MKKTSFLLVVVFALALSLRLPALAARPVGFTPDEAAFGYNAYSLLLTGKDEWGTPAYLLPFTNLRSFGDYKLPLYAFLAVPFVKLFGLNEFAVRLPNALIGSLAVISLFYLSSKLTKSYFISLASSLFMAVSPWSIGLSRGAFEANLATLFLPLAVYLFLTGRFLLAAVYSGLAFYSYHSARFLIVPVIALCFIYQKYIVRNTSEKLIKYLFTFIILLPGLYSLFGPGFSRAADVGIFHPTDNWQGLLADRFFVIREGLPDIFARIYYAKPIYLITQTVSNYLSYFSPQFLFSTGAGESTYGLVPGNGLLYILDLPLLLIFLYQLFRRPSGKMVLILVFILLLPVPAALAKGPGNAANRAVLMLPFLNIAAAVGFKTVRRYSWLVLAVLFISLSQFLVTYIYQSPQSLAVGMLYGRRELFTRLRQLENSASQIRVSRTLSEPHIYLAFYDQIPPRSYQLASQSWTDLGKNGYSFLDQTNYSLGKYYFSGLSFGGSDPTVILVGRPQDFEIGYPRLFNINSPSGASLIQVSPIRL